MSRPECSIWSQPLPAFFHLLRSRTYTVKAFLSDLIAGVTVGLVALPLAMAFGIASGVRPEQGIYTAIVAGFIISMFGGSKVQIGGPTGAFIIIVSGIIHRFGLSGLWMVTVMAGVMLIGMGVTGLGTMVKYIPRPIIIGFTNGIALLIASTQIKDFFGLQLKSVPDGFFPRMVTLWTHMHTCQYATIIVAAVSLAIILFWPKITKRIPSYIVALLVGSLMVVGFHMPVETIGSHFGGIPTGLPPLRVPTIDPSMIFPLLPSALTVALLSAIESLLSAVVADGMIQDRHHSNIELIANGLANLTVPIVSGIPATGAIARTATNVRSGGRSPVAGMIHALTLLVILLVAAPLTYAIPLSTLAAILFVVAYNMGEWHEVTTILRLSKAEIAVWFTTFILTVFVTLTTAVEIGMTLAAMLYIYRVSQTTTVSHITDDFILESRPHILENQEFPPYVSIIRIHGPFLFGSTEKLTDITQDISLLRPIVILRLRDMMAIDATGLHAIETFAKQLQASGRVLLLCGIHGQPKSFIEHSALLQQIGSKHLLPHISSALQCAKEEFEGMN